MGLHPWWSSFGSEVAEIDTLTPVLARELALLAANGVLPGTRLVGMKESSEAGYVVLALEIDVERPQDLAHPIRAVEPIAVAVPYNGMQPSILSLRGDFPDTLHQNWSPPGGPYALCVDDRPWAEAQLTVSPQELIRRIQLWLAKAARGELHDAAQPPEPLFFTSHLGLLLPFNALTNEQGPVELAGFVRPDNENLILTHPVGSASPAGPAFTVLAFQAQSRGASRLRHAPRTLADLATELEPHGVQLVESLKTHLKEWSGLGPSEVRRLSTRLAIVVAFPVACSPSPDINDIRAFITYDTAGDVGVALGVLYRNETGVGDKRAYMLAVSEGAPSAAPIQVAPAEVYSSLNRDLAANVAGHESADRRSAVLIGAGSLGSQLAVALAREGAFEWTIVDNDFLLPHNLVRHALFADDVGAPKAGALASHLAALLGEPTEAIEENLLNSGEESNARLTAAMERADLIIDASASVAVSRHLSDLRSTSARRFCAFFNPSGTSVILLAEAADRSIVLRDLEAQYYRYILTDESLADHLTTSGVGVRYTGSCRALTNRIPASNAAILSALVARGIVGALKSDDATITVWTMTPEGEVRRLQRSASPVTRIEFGSWRVSYDDGLLSAMADMRAAKLPDETGGVLLGIADVSRDSIHVAHALPPPEDSRGSHVSFERGVVDLAEQVSTAGNATMHQLRYVGEWHSHPDHSSPMPSATDISQLLWLGEELENEGLPGVMAIAAQKSDFVFAVSDARERPTSKPHDREQ